MTGAALITPYVPAWAHGLAQPAADGLAKMRAMMGAMPIAQSKLTDRLTLLSGPGGNIAVLTGPDGTLVVDTFVQPAWEALRKTLASLNSAPVKTVIDTHWHFDHADNNANFRSAGAAVLAHANTAKRLTETHVVLGNTIPPSPKEALPTETFASTHRLSTNGEQIELGHIPPSHTDTDIFIRFTKGNVLHLGDTFFNGMYPVIDGATGGSINGMIRAIDFTIKQVDAGTKIIPGHGPIGDRESLMRFGEMMTAARDSVQKLKTAGRSLKETIAANPTKALDATWGKGFLQPADFVAMVYSTLP